jgi:hypothetical protein
MINTTNQTNISSTTQFDNFRYRPQRGLVYTNFTGANILLTSGQLILNDSKYIWNSITQLFEIIGSTLPYVLTVAITDWIVSGNSAIISILATTHGKGNNPNVETYETVGADSNKNECDVTVNDSTGDVTISITNTTQFNGKIVIS